MLKIRLQRSGRKKRPNYRIVVAEHSAPIQGRYVDMLGTFDPLIDKHGLVVDTDKIEEWIKKGAKPTNTVARLLKGQGVKGMEAYIIEMKDRKVKNPKEVPEKPAAEAPAAEAPAEETPSEPEAPKEEDKPAEEPAPADATDKADEPKEEKKEEAPADAPADEEKKEDAPAEDTPPAEGEESSDEEK